MLFLASFKAAKHLEVAQVQKTTRMMMTMTTLIQPRKIAKRKKEDKQTMLEKGERDALIDKLLTETEIELISRPLE